MIQFLLKRIFSEIVNGEKVMIHGLESHVDDSRDFKYADLGGWFDYKPKNKVLTLQMFDVKTQGTNNTCVFHSYASSREFVEGVQLSPRSMVLYAKAHGLLRSNGLSSLREGQKCGIDFGVAEESLVPNDLLTWTDYSGLRLSDDISKNAAKHKAKSYFLVRGRNEWLKALDDGHCIHTGGDWYSAYNMSGGLKAPWVLPWRKGWKVGGHAFACRGYSMDGSKELLRFRNSFGPSWGDEGDFYVRATDIFKEDMVGYVAVDLDQDSLVQFIASHNGKNVKSAKRPAIYRIQSGVRRPYPDALTFYAWGGQFPPNNQTFEEVSDSLLDLIPEGDPMKPEECPRWAWLASEWESLKWAEQNYALHRIHEIITKDI